MLKIENLHAFVGDTEILKGISLHIRAGEVHAIMGPNGSGKSTLAGVLAGRPEYRITQGSITFLGKNIAELSPEERAVLGLFLGFQYPVEIPGVTNMSFLKMACNSLQKARGEPEVKTAEWMRQVRALAKDLSLNEAFLKRGVNEGFSGGEKKRNEILQLLLLQPKLAVLDETDSGLDIDALQIVSKGINQLRGPSHAILLITHYQRLLDYVVPDYIHVQMHGRIVKSGDAGLARVLEEKGYAWLEQV